MEAEGVGGMVEEESGAVGQIGGVRVKMILEETRELRGGTGVIKEILAEENITRIETKGNADVK